MNEQNIKTIYPPKSVITKIVNQLIIHPMQLPNLLHQTFNLSMHLLIPHSLRLN